jgi:hypothetical protein
MAKTPRPVDMSGNMYGETIVDLHSGNTYAVALADSGGLYWWGSYNSVQKCMLFCCFLNFSDSVQI